MNEPQKVDVCPYCGEPAGALSAGDESIDYCHECEQIIEGQTKSRDETEDERLDRLAQEQENMEQRQHESNLYNQGYKP